MKNIDKKYFDNPEQYIPNGWYCYRGAYVCPFWDKDETKPEQASGYCHYLKEGDWQQNYTSLLWDMCKECDVNDFMDEEI